MPEGQESGAAGTGRITISDTAAWQVVEERVVMLDLGAEHYYRLDPVGSCMWELIAELGDLDAVHARLANRYDVDPVRLRDDLDELVAKLSDAGLVQVEPPAP